MKRFFFILLAGAFCATVGAVPAYRGGVPVTLNNGQTVTVYQHGDEYFHYTTLANGEWVKIEDGVMTKVPALTPAQIQQKRNASPLRRMRNQIQTEIPLNIAPKGLIILVNFANLAFQDENDLASMQEMHNGDHYTYNGATGSARKYFMDQSFGQYQPQFDVVGPVTVSKNYAYYGKESIAEGNDAHVDVMISEACALADEQFNVDFSQYDHNNDGFVDFVFFVYAGNQQAEGAPSNTIWPHAYWVYSGYGKTLRFDGKLIDSYACSSELTYTSMGGTTRAGIGTFCHEFSHVLGLPDLYVTQANSDHQTLADWDIMDYGPYNNNGRTPPAYSAYERFFCGWLVPEVINEPGYYTLPELNASQKAYLVSSTGVHNLVGNNPNPTTFYLLENRQRKGWDLYLPGHGMLLTKVQYSYTKWANNVVNDTQSRQGVDLIEAGGTPTSYRQGKTSDAFPRGATDYTEITNYPITDITESISDNGLIAFNFMGSTPVENVWSDENDPIIAVFNTLGQLQTTTDLQSLPRGLYIVKTAKSVRKISIL